MVGTFPLMSPPTKILVGYVPGIPGGVDAYDYTYIYHTTKTAKIKKKVIIALQHIARMSINNVVQCNIIFFYFCSF